MKAVEVMGKVDDKGQLLLDEPLDIKSESRVKVILLISDEDELDPDDTPVEEIKASLIRALQDAKAGRRIPLEQMWEGIDAE
ncbi:MAG: type II toxin-antitoxin system RelN family antitoxin [Chroococcales cyanobacterium]